MAGARWPIAGALGAAATCALLWGCPDAHPLVVGVGGTSPTSSSSSSSGTSTTTTSSSTTGTGGSVGCSAANLFAPGADYSAGMLLSGIATGDMNGDGKPDLVISSAEANPPSVVVLLNKGQGTFMPYSYTTVDGPGPLAVADLDGDGKSDVAVGTDGTEVGVALGDGDGGLGMPAYITVPNRVAGLAAADLNADGKPDLAVANPLGTQSGGVSVLVNMGGAAFADPFPYPVPSGCVSVAVADLDGDGKPDLAIACGPAGATDTGHVYVLINTGGGMFATPMEYAIGVNPSAIVAVDLTGDGKPDLAVADSGNGMVDVLINKGTVFAAGGTYPAGAGAQSIAAADLNGDGHTDLVVSNQQPSDGGDIAAVDVLLNHGDGTFDMPLVFPMPAVTIGVVATDLNGDGKADVAVARADGMVTVLLNGCP